jgi:hypothetical protein
MHLLEGRRAVLALDSLLRYRGERGTRRSSPIPLRRPGDENATTVEKSQRDRERPSDPVI